MSLVSIIIPAFNQAAFLPLAIESACNQVSAEVFVVDDGSTDDTPRICKEYASQIRYLRKPNAGLSAARNSGILATSSEWLVFLDSDDLLPPGYVAAHLAMAEERPDADVFYSTYHYVDRVGHPFGPRFNPILPEAALHVLLMGTHFAVHAAMVRRAAMANVGLFDVTLRSLEDWDLWIRLAAFGSRFVRTPGISVPYRMCVGSMSRNHERMRRCGMRVLSKNAHHHGGNCYECRRATNQGRWGVRSAYWTHLAANGEGLATNTWRLTGEIASDPLLLAYPMRQTLRRIKHSLRRR